MKTFFNKLKCKKILNNQNNKINNLLLFIGLYFVNFEIISFFNGFNLSIYSYSWSVSLAGIIAFTAHNFLFGFLFLSLSIVFGFFLNYGFVIIFLFLISFILTSFFLFDISYVAFFKQQVQLQDIIYLSDPDFLKGSVPFIYSFYFILPFVLNLISFLVFYLYFFKKVFYKNSISLKFIIIVGLSPLISFVTYDSVKVFCLSKLGYHNLLYEVFLSSGEKKITYRFNLQEDYRIIYKTLYKKDQNLNSFSEEKLKNLIENYSNSITLNQSKFSLNIKNSVKNILDKKEPIYFWIVLLESYKPQHGKNLFPQNSVSFEPFTDDLAKNSLSFKNAWTAGGHTRIGQQAALCGIYSGAFSDAVLHVYRYSFKCLQELIAEKYQEQSYSVYWQAVNLRFQNFYNFFWSTHHFDRIIGPDNFHSNAPSTGWGVSDRTLIKYLLNQLKLNPMKDKLIQLHAISTVTNHGPFQTPSDMFSYPENYFSKAQGDDARTVYYTDQTLKELIMGLKSLPITSRDLKESIWDHSVIFIVNDHGVNTFDSIYPNGHVRTELEELDDNNRANLILSGGIIQKEIKTMDSNEKFKIENSLKSQVDIYSTVLDVLNYKHIHSLGESLLNTNRSLPVIPEPSESFYVYFPSPWKLNDGIYISRKEALTSTVSELEHLLPKNPQQRGYYKTALALFQSNDYFKFNALHNLSEMVTQK